MKRNFVLFFASIVLGSITGCVEQAKEADIDGDATPDILVKGNKLVDLNRQDNIFVYDGVVVNAITNDQWYLNNEQLAIVEHPQFKMSYDSMTQSWKKIDNSAE